MSRGFVIPLGECAPLASPRCAERVPHSQGAVVRARSELRTLLREGQRPERPLMRDEAPPRARTWQMPEDKATILTARSYSHSVGTKGEACHSPRVAVPAEQADAFGLLEVPHTYRGVVRARCDI